MYTGVFGYHKGAAILHHTPAGMTADGHPVIVFPGQGSAIIADRIYAYHPRMTRNATYVIDGVTFRVAHATMVTAVSHTEGDTVDALIHGPKAPSPAKLADGLDPGVLGRLEALKKRLVA